MNNYQLVPQNKDSLPKNNDSTKLYTEPKYNDSLIYTDIDIEGEFMGGSDSLMRFVADKFTMPKTAQELGISGVVLLQFVVEIDGSISDVRAVFPKDRNWVMD